MSRDRRGDRTQEVVGSIPISSTNRAIVREPPRGGSLRFLAGYRLQLKRFAGIRHY